jgi:hypothetical protein
MRNALVPGVALMPEGGGRAFEVYQVRSDPLGLVKAPAGA